MLNHRNQSGVTQVGYAIHDTSTAFVNIDCSKEGLFNATIQPRSKLK